MKDITLFLFGLIATLMALGPLGLALILDIRSKNEKK